MPTVPAASAVRIRPPTRPSSSSSDVCRRYSTSRRMTPSSVSATSRSPANRVGPDARWSRPSRRPTTGARTTPSWSRRRRGRRWTAPPHSRRARRRPTPSGASTVRHPAPPVPTPRSTPGTPTSDSGGWPRRNRDRTAPRDCPRAHPPAVDVGQQIQAVHRGPRPCRPVPASTVPVTRAAPHQVVRHDAVGDDLGRTGG